MLVEHRPQVQLVEMIGAEHDEGLRPVFLDGLQLLEQGVPVALREAVFRVPLPRREQAQAVAGAVEVPGAAAGEVPVEKVRTVLLGDPHIADLRVREIGERDVDEPVGTGQGDGRLGTRVGQRGEPAAAATGEDERDRVGCVAVHGTMVRRSVAWRHAQRRS